MNRIIIIDAGLGGLSIHAMIDKALKKKSVQAEIEFIFFNVMTKSGKLFNHMTSVERIKTFEIMLDKSIQFDPTVILIACNSLSVIYPMTRFSRQIKLPIVGIIDLGVKMILNNIKNQPNSNILIVGTPITIASKAHEEKLIGKGINKNRIICQACKDLQFEIQNGDYEKVGKMILQYLEEAKRKIIHKSEPVFLVLGCTHYQFAKSIFKRIAKNVFESEVFILNPNEAMSKVIHLEKEAYSNTPIKLTHKVYSNMQITKEEIQNIGAAIQKDSLAVYQALKNYAQL